MLIACEFSKIGPKLLVFTSLFFIRRDCQQSKLWKISIIIGFILTWLFLWKIWQNINTYIIFAIAII